MSTATASPNKSTIVRSSVRRAPAPLAAFRTLEWVAPGLAARWAERLWFTVPRAGAAVNQPDPPGGTEFVRADWPGPDRQWQESVGRSWGEGPAVYLVHGWGGWAGQLGAFVAPLVAAGYRVITFDAPEPRPLGGRGGFGPRRTTGLEFSEAANRRGRRARSAAYAVIIAHSLGGIGVGDAAAAPGSESRPAGLPLADVEPGEPTSRMFSAIVGLGTRPHPARLPGSHWSAGLAGHCPRGTYPALGREITACRRCCCSTTARTGRPGRRTARRSPGVGRAPSWSSRPGSGTGGSSGSLGGGPNPSSSSAPMGGPEAR